VLLARSLGDDERLGLLAGWPAGAPAAHGPVVCACFGVGLHTLRRAIREDRLSTIDAIGAALRAGTNCGSCIPELKQLLRAEAPAA
jgi:assimilatory nitrate reductase catalytic subunit